MIPLNMPVETVGCTSEVIQIDARTSRESKTGLGIPNVRVMVVNDAPSPLGSLSRSLEYVDLAERVASGLPDNPDFSDDWIARLVDDFSKFND